MKTLLGLLGVLALAGPVLRSGDDTPAVTRLKDLVTLEGVRDNQLIGYGLVVGLAGTGDRQQSQFPYRSLANLLQRMGVVVDPTVIQVKNTAAVMVTATLPPFAQPGMRIDVTTSSMGEAQNLQGGLLVMTPLQGVDGAIYAMAQGPVVTGGFVAGKGGTTQTVNHPTVGRVPNGAIIERLSPSRLPQTPIKLQLREADFITASRVAKAVNSRFAAGTAPIAHAENAGLVSVALLSQANLGVGKVYEAADGREAMDAVKQQPVGLILSDINMPNMDGLQFLSELRSHDQWKHVPVLMISTEGSQTKVMEAVQSGAQGFVRKPFTADQIKEKLAGIL